MNPRIFHASWITVFFLQALRVIFSTMFGVIYDQIFEGPMSLWLPVSNVLVVLALLAPAIIGRRVTRSWILATGLVALIARIPLSFDDATLRYWGSLAVIISAGSYLWMALRRSRHEFARALLWGLLWEYLLRVLGDTFDLSLHDGSLLFVGLWVAVLAGIGWWLYRQAEEEPYEEQGVPWSLALGLGSFIFLEMTLLALPSAVARYSSLDYPLIAVLLFLASATRAIPALNKLLDPLFLKVGTRLGLNLLATLGFLCGYFLDGWLAAGGLLLAQWIVVAGFIFVLESADAISSKGRWRFPLGMTWMLTLNFLNAFAFTYPYTLPAMRERGWVVHLAALLVLGWSGLGALKQSEKSSTETSRTPAILLTAGTLLIAVCVWPRPPAPLPQGSLRLATWNIHYGYDDDWHTNLQEMAAVIAAEGVDVIALQEVDTGRMTSYSTDNAYFLARRLGMQVVYLPAVEQLTGIALLYKGPAAPSDTHFLTSLQEQTGVIQASLDWGSAGLEAYGIWMGLSDEDTMRQVDEALTFIGPASPASFGGDFNARPDDPEIDAIRVAGFADPFVLLGFEDPEPTSPAIDPRSRIDFVWLRGLVPQKAWVSGSLASDHRMVVVEVVQP